MIFFEKKHTPINAVLFKDAVKNIVHLPPKVMFDLR